MRVALIDSVGGVIIEEIFSQPLPDTFDLPIGYEPVGFGTAIFIGNIIRKYYLKNFVVQCFVNGVPVSDVNIQIYLEDGASETSIKILKAVEIVSRLTK